MCWTAKTHLLEVAVATRQSAGTVTVEGSACHTGSSQAYDQQASLLTVMPPEAAVPLLVHDHWQGAHLGRAHAFIAVPQWLIANLPRHRLQPIPPARWWYMAVGCGRWGTTSSAVERVRPLHKLQHTTTLQEGDASSRLPASAVTLQTGHMRPPVSCHT